MLLVLFTSTLYKLQHPLNNFTVDKNGTSPFALRLQWLVTFGDRREAAPLINDDASFVTCDRCALLPACEPANLTVSLFLGQSSLIFAATSAVGWCFCTACASLLSACCGNDKKSTIPPSITSGRKRSVLLLFLALGLALVFQYYVGPLIIDSDQYTGFLSDRWLDGCSEYEGAFLEECAGNMGVFRVAAATTLFFVLAGIAAACKPTANREAWPAKYVLFVFICQWFHPTLLTCASRMPVERAQTKHLGRSYEA